MFSARCARYWSRKERRGNPPSEIVGTSGPRLLNKKEKEGKNTKAIPTPEVAPPEGATCSAGLPAGLPWGGRGGIFFFCLQHHTCTTTGVLTPVVHRWCCKQKTFLPARTLLLINIYFLKGLWFIHPSINPSIHSNIWQSYMFDENFARIVFFRCVRHRVFDEIWSPKKSKFVFR